MSKRRVWITQLLCPQRHCIIALVGEADDRADAKRIELQVRETFAEMREAGAVNGWCGICGAEESTWHYETGRTRWRTLAEATPTLQEEEAKQLLTSELLGTHGKTPPGRA